MAAVMVANAAATGIRSEPLMTFMTAPRRPWCGPTADPCRPASLPQVGQRVAGADPQHPPARGPQQLDRAVHLGGRHAGPGRASGSRCRCPARWRWPAVEPCRSRASSRVSSRSRRAEHRDEQPVAAAAAQRRARVPQAGVGRELQHRERVEQRALEVAAHAARVVRGARDVGSRVGQQPHVVAVPHQVHADRGRGRHRPLERRAGALAAVRGGPGVEQQGARAPATAAPRGGPSPCPAGRWSASAPGAGRRPGGTRGSPASSSPALASDRARLSPLPVHSPDSATDGQLLHRRGHDEGVAGAERALQLAHAERVGQPDRQRTEAVAAAHVRPHGVGHLAAAARLDPVEHEPRPGPEHVGDLVLDQQQPGRQPGDVLQPQGDRWSPGRRRCAPDPRRRRDDSR